MPTRMKSTALKGKESGAYYHLKAIALCLKAWYKFSLQNHLAHKLDSV